MAAHTAVPVYSSLLILITSMSIDSAGCRIFGGFAMTEARGNSFADLPITSPPVHCSGLHDYFRQCCGG